MILDEIMGERGKWIETNIGRMPQKLFISLEADMELSAYFSDYGNTPFRKNTVSIETTDGKRLFGMTISVDPHQKRRFLIK